MENTLPSDEGPSGYVYVLTNPSLVGQVKVGQTQRHPTQRAQELSSATGVPTSFEVSFYKQFEDCVLAEKLVHLQLNEGPLKVQKNKEFFSCEPSTAVAVIEEVYARLAAHAPEQDCARLMARATALLERVPQCTADLNQALILWEYAFQLGEPAAGYFAAQTAYRLMGRKAGNSLQEALLEERAAHLLQQSGLGGVARAWADLALLRHCQGAEPVAQQTWRLYFDAFPEKVPPPQELDYLVQLLAKHYFAKSASAASLVFLKNNKQIVKAGVRLFPKDVMFQKWLKGCCWSRSDFLIEKGRLPTLYAVGVGILWLANPELAMALGLATVAYFLFRRKKPKK